MNSISMQTWSTEMALVHPVNPLSAFAQELREEHAKGIEQGLAQERIQVVDAMIAKGCEWSFITDITQLDQAGYQALKDQQGHS